MASFKRNKKDHPRNIKRLNGHTHITLPEAPVCTHFEVRVGGRVTNLAQLHLGFRSPGQEIQVCSHPRWQAPTSAPLLSGLVHPAESEPWWHTNPKPRFMSHLRREFWENFFFPSLPFAWTDWKCTSKNTSVVGHMRKLAWPYHFTPECSLRSSWLFDLVIECF